ncbi:MAG: hypothetical protein ACW98J_07830 [Candidatus Thorarchaeota archaeon]|jgi:hypothetical protein
MTDTKTRLKAMVDENVSSIQLMSERLGVEMDEVVTLLEEMISDGSVEGQVTQDGLRFFRETVKVSEAPKIPVQQDVPDFMKYDSRPGKIMVIIGFAIIVAGLVVSYMASDSHSAFLLYEAAFLLLIGIILIMLGGCQVGRRPTPM